MSFASSCANVVDFLNMRRRPYCFKIQGQIYYQINTSILPKQGAVQNFDQLYFIDKNESIEHRVHIKHIRR